MNKLQSTHLPEGRLRAWLDNELPGAQRLAVEAHLQTCQVCQEEAAILRRRAEQVGAQMQVLNAQGVEKPRPARSAWQQLENESFRKEQTMFNKLFTRRSRPAWMAVGVVVVLAVALAFPQVRALAVDFLGLFRVQQVEFVQVDADSLASRMNSSQQLEQLFAEDVQVDVQGESQQADSAAQAGELAGISVRLPDQLGEPAVLNVEPAAAMRFTVDVVQLTQILKELGLSDIELPATLDGAEVTANMPSLVYAAFGECGTGYAQGAPEGYDPDDPATWPVFSECTTLVQMASPTVDAPAGLDLQQLGQVYLQVLGMTPEEAQRFSQNIDWATTLVVPMPSMGAAYRDVSVDGVTGTFASQQGAGKDYLLIWVKDGIVYALQGMGTVNDALEIARSMK